jgi:hypothetical protein
LLHQQQQPPQGPRKQQLPVLLGSVSLRAKQQQGSKLHRRKDSARARSSSSGRQLGSRTVKTQMRLLLQLLQQQGG